MEFFTNRNLANELSEAKKKIDTLQSELDLATQAIRDLNQQIVEDKRKHDFEIESLESRRSLDIALETEQLKTKNQDLKLDNGVQKKEIEILTKAFENMGFDVKDMKSILEKLVDGLISKNSINVIK